MMGWPRVELGRSDHWINGEANNT